MNETRKPEGVRVKVLAIDDEPPIRRLLKTSFMGTEFELIEAGTGQEGIQLVARENPELVLLDLGLPDIDGVLVTRHLREWSNVPIIVLSARGQEQQKVESLEAGADDYMTKPFGVRELIARMRIALRHKNMMQTGQDSSVFESGPLKVDMSSRKVWLKGNEIHLTPIEYKLLTVLIRHAGKVVTHRQLLLEVWGAAYSEETQYLRVYMGYLRRKIEETPFDPKMLLTEPRVGYRLALDEARSPTQGAAMMS